MNCPSSYPKLKTINPQEPEKASLATILEWLDIWFDLETGKTISRKYPKPDGSNWVSATRETNTMPNGQVPAGIIYVILTPKNSNVLVDKKRNPIGEAQTFT